MSEAPPAVDAVAIDAVATGAGAGDPAGPAAGPPPVRFTAPDYAVWAVHEVHDPHAASGTSLIFASPAGFRRVRRFPAHWRTLSPAERWALSWQC
jgi:hypothetical protein